MNLFTTPISSPVLIALTIAYFVVASVATFDMRMIQAKRDGTLPSDELLPSSWVGLFYYMMWGVWIAVLFLNWKYAIFLFVVKFVLSVLPILETIGNVLLSPFKR